MTRLNQFTFAAALCSVLAGCRGTAYEVAEYEAYSFTRSPSSTSYRYLSIHLEDAGKQAPPIEVMLSNGKTFRCDSLTEVAAKESFPSCKEYDSTTGNKTDHITHCDDDGVIDAFFENGRLTSLNLDLGAKFRKAGHAEFLTLPIEEDEMIRVFGKPKTYRRVYSKQP